MGIDDKPTPGTAKVPSPGTALLILGTIADTTWRMFGPVVVFLLLGLWLDKRFDTQPWYILSGVILGFALAVVLVYLQYRNVKGTSPK